MFRGTKPTSEETNLHLKKINKEFSAYVAVVKLFQVGSTEMRYWVCRERNDGEEDCSAEGLTAQFQINRGGNLSQGLAINVENFEIDEAFFFGAEYPGMLPGWQFSKPTEFMSTWTRIEILEGSDDISPPEAPPFFVYRLTYNGKKIAHLPKGVKKEQYGDLFDGHPQKSDRFYPHYDEVMNYCDNYTIDNHSWDLGHKSFCREDQGYILIDG